MKALVLTGNGVFVYKEVPMPQKYHQKAYLLRVYAAGICGSDLHRGFEGGVYHYPLVMGHEFSAVIEEDFSGSLYKKGDTVAVYPLLPCGQCDFCYAGDFIGCKSYDYLGSRRDGAFAEYVYAPEQNLFLLPEHLDPLHAAMSEPCAVTLHGVRTLSIRGGETAAVFGGGAIGNMAAQWLRVLGSRRIIVVEIDEKKLKIAEEMGFETVNPKNDDPVSFILRRTRDRGAHIVVEAAGLPVTFTQAIESAGRHGEVLLLGTLNREVTFLPEQLSHILRNEITIHGSWNSSVVPAGRDDWSTVLSYMDREIQLSPLISHTPPLENGPEIFRMMYEKKEFFNKVIFILPKGD